MFENAQLVRQYSGSGVSEISTIRSLGIKAELAKGPQEAQGILTITDIGEKTDTLLPSKATGSEQEEEMRGT